ncbi:MAG: glutamine synthetase family protein [Alicyclobacillus shizuokensis]|nr:glutamine synthetase family protein [Alicyclobacillus shizuokensis]
MRPTEPTTAEEWRNHVHALVREHQIQAVRVCVQDLANIARARYVSTRHFLEQLEADQLSFPSALFGLPASSRLVSGPEGTSFPAGFPSWPLRADLGTFSVLPYAPGVARVIADMYNPDGLPLPHAPREVLRRALKRLAERGWRLCGSYEYEFYLLRRTDDGWEPAWSGLQCFSETVQAQLEPVLLDILQTLQELGAGPEVANTEYGSGQFEVSNAPFWDIEIADMAFYYRTSIREVAAKHGYLATFMSKPRAGMSGSGAHLHHSLHDANGTNLFYDEKAPDGLSAICRWFMAGQLEHASSIAAVTCGTLNAFKRLRAHSFAPTRVCWGYEHRGAMIRVPRARGEQTRLENRVPGADADPYLTLAVILAAGLDGIDRKLEPPPPVRADPYESPDWRQLPRTFEQGLQVLRTDAWLREVLGDATVDMLVSLREADYESFLDSITDWEWQTYQDVF